MQLRISNATFANGSDAVTISGITSGAEEVDAGSLIKRDGEATAYVVASRTPSSGASLTAVTLSVNYAGSSGTGPCQIVNNFSPSREYPLTYKGDGDPADWIRRALTMIDTDIAAQIAAFPITPGSAGAIAYATGTALAWSAVGTAGQVLVSNAGAAPSWASDIAGNSGTTSALKCATGSVDVAAAPAPSAGQVLTASGAGAAAWASIGTADATNALKSATTTINVSAATAPTAGQVLTATDGTHATWQDAAGATLENTYFLQGKTSAGVAKRLIGVTASNYVQLDADGLGILAGSTGGLQITSADGTLRANGTGVATGRVLYTNSNAEIVAASNLANDGTNVAIGWGGPYGAYLLDTNGKGRFDRVLIGTAGSPTIAGSLGYVSSSQTVLRAAFGIQLLANTYASADAASSAFTPGGLQPHVVIPCQDSTKIGLGIFQTTGQTGPLLYIAKSTAVPLFAIGPSGGAYFYGSTSGSVALQAPAVAGTQVYTLPSGYGSNGQLLTSDGAGGMSWTTVSGGGSGTVNAGTAGALAYYATTGTAVSELTTPAAGQVLTSGAAPAWSASPTLTDLTLSSLTASGYIVYADASKKLVNSTSMYFSAASGRIELYHSLNTSTTSGMVDITCNNSSGLGLHVATPGSSASQYAVRIGSAAFRDDLAIMANGKIGIGASYAAGTFTELVNFKNASYIGGINAAGTATKKLIGLTAGDLVSLDGTGVGIVAGSGATAITNATGNLLATALDGVYKQGTNGQKCELKQLTELHALAAATSSDTTIQIPAGSLLIAVDARVTTTVVGPTSWQYGVAVDTARFGSGLALASSTTNAGLQDGPRYYPSATSIRFEGAGGAFSAGVIRVTIHFIEVTPAQS